MTTVEKPLAAPPTVDAPSSRLRRLSLTIGIALAGVLLWLLLALMLRDGWLALGITLMAVLAYNNGANDVSKVIATLVGSGVGRVKPALLYGAAWTMVGSACSGLLAAGLVSTFTSGLLASSVHLTIAFALAAVGGTIAWVFLSTRLALPVSTTHAITGAVVTTGVLAFGVNQIAWFSLLTKIVLPLLLSPVMALLLGVLLFWLFARLLPPIRLSGLHWASSGIAAFTRGLNDTPKMVALGVTFFALHGPLQTPPYWLFLLCAAAIGAGSALGGLKVTRTLAEKVTKMDHQEGFAANLATAILVGLASPLSLPVSTTHVSSGAIIGIGLRKGIKQIRWKTVRDMALAWIITLPGAGLLSLVIYLVLNILIH